MFIETFIASTHPVTTTVEKVQNETSTSAATKTTDSANATVRATQPKPTENCTSDEWDNNNIIFNHTLVGGINSGEFREHGRKENMTDCMRHCCSEKDCDLSFMIDHDCYTVKCAKPELCKTRVAKTTSFLPQIAFKRKPMLGKFIDKQLDLKLVKLVLTNYILTS